MPDPKPLLYSYNRVSSGKQRDGRGGRRQDEDAKRYADEHGYVLDDKLKLTDTGSAWDETNITSGTLGKFVARIKAGTIEPGSVLFVENLDRLTRAVQMTANRLLLDILEGGIKIVWQDPHYGTAEELTAELVNRYPDKLRDALNILSRANMESERKSQMLRRSWEMKRADMQAGGKSKHKCPTWCRWRQDEAQAADWKANGRPRGETERGGYVPRQPQWEVVRRIVTNYLGGLTVERICHGLDADKVPTFGSSSGWIVSSVNNLLKNPTIKGTRTLKTGGKRTKHSDRPTVAEPIPGYYPAVINDAEWHRVQAKLKANRISGHGRPGPNGRVNNLFRKRLYDAADGNPIYMRTNDAAYLVNKDGLHGKARGRHVSFPYDLYEWGVLLLCDEITADDLIPRSAPADVRAALDEAEAKLAAGKTKLANLQAKMTDGDEDILNALAPVAAKVAASVRSHEQSLGRLRGRLYTADPEEVGQLAKLVRGGGGGNREANRAKFRAAWADVVDRGDVTFTRAGRFALAATTVQFRGGQWATVLTASHRHEHLASVRLCEAWGDDPGTVPDVRDEAVRAKLAADFDGLVGDRQGTDGIKARIVRWLLRTAT